MVRFAWCNVRQTCLACFFAGGRTSSKTVRVFPVRNSPHSGAAHASQLLLLDLQALAVREGEIFEFAEKMTRLRERHARKPSLIDRFDRARLH